VVCCTPARVGGNGRGDASSESEPWWPARGREHDRIAAEEPRGLDERDESREAPGVDGREVRRPAAYAISDAAAEGAGVFVLEGELDLAAAPLLHARLDEYVGRALVLDLEHVTFVDSAVLKELLRARAELPARDVRLVLAGVPPPVRRLLDLTRTSELFEDAPDVETAFRRLNG
jgi:anti-sigma B factor antagonist